MSSIQQERDNEKASLNARRDRGLRATRVREPQSSRAHVCVSSKRGRESARVSRVFTRQLLG